MASSRLVPTNETVATYGAGKTYTDLNTWEAATDLDMVATTTSYTLECDAGTYDDDIDMQGAADDTDASYFRVVRPAAGSFHSGIYGAGVVFTPSSPPGGIVMWCQEKFSGFQDLEVDNHSGAGFVGGFALYADQSHVVGCISRRLSTSGNSYVAGIYTFNASSGENYIVNCIVDAIHNSHGSTTKGAEGIWMGTNVNARVYNCNAINITATSGNGDFFGYRARAASLLKNSVTHDSEGINGTNITETTNTTSTPTYIGAPNYHLAAGDTVCRGNGTDLSGDAEFAFDDDIDVDTRSAWDIGWDEFQAVPSVGMPGFLTDRTTGGLLTSGRLAR